MSHLVRPWKLRVSVQVDVQQRCRRRACAIGALLGVLLVAEGVGAHPGLHHDIDRVTATLQAEPNRPELYVERGALYRLNGQFEESLADLDTARRLNPAQRAVALQRGLTLSGMGRDAEAEAELTGYLDAGGPSAEALSARACIRARNGRPHPAIADYSAAIARNPDVELFLARGALQESVGDLDAAAAGYAEALARLGGAVTVRDALIRVETQRGRFARALELIDEVLPQLPVKTEWHLRRADVLAAAGKDDEARQDRERALAEADGSVQRRRTALTLCARAKVLLALGRLDAARADVRAAAQMAPRYAGVVDLQARLAPWTTSHPGGNAPQP